MSVHGARSVVRLHGKKRDRRPPVPNPAFRYSRPSTYLASRRKPPVSRLKVFALTVLAMMAFAGNSLLCRVALKDGHADAASFTAIRIVAGAAALGLILAVRDRGMRDARNSPGIRSWPAAAALFAYAASFSFAYRSLPAGTGALLLFGAVQATMILYGIWSGERLGPRQLLGLAIAVGGLIGLVMPGLAAPPPLESAAMVAAGVAWGAYSLLGRGAGDPLAATTANFVRAAPLAIVLGLAFLALTWQSNGAELDNAGIAYAILSGAVTSGVGYAIWYTALRGLTATTAATVQLSVPAIAALGGIALLGELLTLRLLLSSAAILGGIALVIVGAAPAIPEYRGTSAADGH